MKVRHLFADGRKRIADVSHMPVRRLLLDDEAEPHVMRAFELSRAEDGKPLYRETGRSRRVLDLEAKPRGPAIEAPPPASE